MNLTPNFSLFEMSYSATAQAKGINNIPPDCVIPNLKDLCKYVMQPLRNYVGKPIIITSGYRNAVLNKMVGGVPSSQHCLGMACDFVINGYDLKKAFNYIKNYLEFDQLLFEYTKNDTKWIHVSYNRNHNRRHAIDNYKA